MRRSYLPSGGAVAVALVLEVGNVLHHPLVHLTQRQPTLRRALDRLRDQVGVRQVAPRVAPRGTLLARVVGVAGGGAPGDEGVPVPGIPPPIVLVTSRIEFGEWPDLLVSDVAIFH